MTEPISAIREALATFEAFPSGESAHRLRELTPPTNIRALPAELDRLKADAERLDFLANKMGCFTVETHWTEPGAPTKVVLIGEDDHKGSTMICDAIDAAAAAIRSLDQQKENTR